MESEKARPPEAKPGPQAPASVRAAGVCVALEGLTGVIVAISLVVRGLLGHSEAAISNYGTAAWFVLLGSAVTVAGAALVLGRRGGYAIALMTQLLLLPVVWALLSGSNQLVLGAIVGVVAVGTLVLLFVPPTLQWKSAG